LIEFHCFGSGLIAGTVIVTNFLGLLAAARGAVRADNLLTGGLLSLYDTTDAASEQKRVCSVIRRVYFPTGFPTSDPSFDDNVVRIKNTPGEHLHVHSH
jgi:hypothetical protein